jgi:hypothetical protein
MDKRRRSNHTHNRDFSGPSKRARPYATKTSIKALEHIHHDAIYTRTACDTAMNTTELLEHVLSHLPPKTILQTQRVSKYWRGVIATSPELQEILCFRAQLVKGPLEIWEVVNFETKRNQPDMPDREAPEHICLMYACHRKVKIRRRVSHPREEADSDDEELLFLPVALMERGRPARRPLVTVDRQGIPCSTATSAVERIRYHGTMALLQQYASMYLTSPPMLAADLRVIVYYRDADASPTAVPVRAELMNVRVENSSGVKLRDLIEAIHRGKGAGCDVFGLDEFVDDRDGRHQVFDVKQHEWEGDWGRMQQETDLIGLEELVLDIYGWKRAVRDPVFELEMFLEESAWKGLRPIVPTEERRAVIEN